MAARKRPPASKAKSGRPKGTPRVRPEPRARTKASPRAEIEHHIADAISGLTSFAFRSTDTRERQAASLASRVLWGVFYAWRTGDLDSLSKAAKWADGHLEAEGVQLPPAGTRRDSTAAQMRMLQAIEAALDKRAPGWSKGGSGAANTNFEWLVLDVMMNIWNDGTCRPILPPPRQDSQQQIAKIIERRAGSGQLQLDGIARDILKHLGMPRAEADRLFKSNPILDWLAHRPST